MFLALLAAAIATPLPYKALGTEPFWSVTVTRGTIRLERPDAPPVVVRGVRRRIAGGGGRFVARGVRMDVVRRRCSDGMSDRVFPDTVTVRFRGALLKGCGGVPAP